jgi:hypothetical protein
VNFQVWCHILFHVFISSKQCVKCCLIALEEWRVIYKIFFKHELKLNVQNVLNYNIIEYSYTYSALSTNPLMAKWETLRCVKVYIVLHTYFESHFLSLTSHTLKNNFSIINKTCVLVRSKIYYAVKRIVAPSWNVESFTFLMWFDNLFYNLMLIFVTFFFKAFVFQN